MYDLSVFPDFALSWAQKCLTQQAFQGVVIDQHEVQRVADWVHSFPQDRPKMIKKLYKVSWPQALQATNAWHDQLAKKASKRSAYAAYADNVETLLTVQGYRWVRLLSAQSRDFEGDSMGHCVGRGAYDGKTILSLRDAQNRPHCTVYWDEEYRYVREAKGRFDQPIAMRYKEPVMTLLDYLDPLSIDGAQMFGQVFLSAEGAKPQFWNWQDLPKTDLLINGDLELSADVPLPSRLTITGAFKARNCTFLRHLPKDLNVQSFYRLDGCTALESLPDRIDTTFDVSLTGCSSLSSLPLSMSVGEPYAFVSMTQEQRTNFWEFCASLRLNGCVSLQRLPEELRVIGNLYLKDCPQLQNIPPDLNVWGCVVR